MRKIIYGKDKAKEYNLIANETETLFMNWLDYSNTDMGEFDKLMSDGPYRIEEEVDEENNYEISLYAGGTRVLAPLVLKMSKSKDTNTELDKFNINALMLFIYIASRNDGNADFSKTVTSWAHKMMSEGKLIL